MRRILGAHLSPYVPALGLWLLTALYLVLAYGYKPMVREFPAGVAWAMLILVSLDLVSRTETAWGRRLKRGLAPEAAAAPERDRPARRELWSVAWVAGFAALLMLAGILVAVPLFMVAALRLRGGRSLVTALAAAGAMTLAIWLVFAVVLRLSLYAGLFASG